MKVNVFFFKIVCCFLVFCESAASQSITFDSHVEVLCPANKQRIRLPFQNRGRVNLIIHRLQKNEESLKLKLSKEEVFPASMAYLEIEYEWEKLKKKDLTVIILHSNDLNRPKITFLLKAVDNSKKN